MGKSQFVMDTGSHCFLCLRGRDGGEGEDDDQDVRKPFSFRNICQYLKVNLKEALTDATADSSSSCSLTLFEEEDSELKGQLCSECAQLLSRFSSHYLELEVLRMKLDYGLKLIHYRMMEARDRGRGTGTSLEEEFRREMGRRPGCLEQVGVVEGLRKRTLEQCTRKLAATAANPSVTVEKMTPSDPVTLLPSNRVKTELPDPCSWLVECDICHMEVLDLFSHLSAVHGETLGSQEDPPEDAESPPEVSQSDSELEIQNEMEVDVGNPHQADLADPLDPNWMSSNMKTCRYECNLCKLEFTQKFSLIRHHREVHFLKIPIRKKPCKKISAGGTTPNPADNQLMSFNPENGRYTCHLCGKELARRSFWAHYRSTHQRVRYECTICGKEFSHRPSFNRHHNSAHGTTGVSCSESFRKKRRIPEELPVS